MKPYETPYAEKIEFDYKEQIVTSSERAMGWYYLDNANYCACGNT